MRVARWLLIVSVGWERDRRERRKISGAARDKGEEYVSAINSSSPFPKLGLDGSHSYVRMINCSMAARERNRSGDLDDLDNRTQGNRCVV